MFDFGFDDFDDSIREARLNDLITRYEDSGAADYFDSEALEEIAAHYFDVGRFESALDAIDHLINQQPYSSDAWMRRGIILNNLGRHKDALDAYDRALAENPLDT